MFVWGRLNVLSQIGLAFIIVREKNIPKVGCGLNVLSQIGLAYVSILLERKKTFKKGRQMKVKGCSLFASIC